MGYVFHTPPTFSSGSTHSLSLASADGGVDYGAGGLSDGEKNERVRNLWLTGGFLTVRPAFGAVGESLAGVRHMAKEFFGAVLLHIGTKLYKFENRTAQVLLEGLPDKKSVPVEFGGKLYLYCDTHIYCIDRALAAKEVYPSAPVYASGRDGNMNVGGLVSDFRPNILAPYVAVVFSDEKLVNGGYGYCFPLDMDKTRPFEVFFEGKPVEKAELKIEETRFSFKTFKQTTPNTVKLCYYTTALSENIGRKLSGCTTAAAFGGGTVEGTRVFLAGNPETPGVYYMSELGDPLAFYEGNVGSLGESCGNITAFSKQNGDLLVFTESSVSRMRYEYQSGGGYFSTKTLHASIGCDMPESVATAGNRTVFACSRGIYFVDSVALFDRMNVVPISRNITSPDKTRGYFSIPADERKAAKACVYDRKYLLCLGQTAFVWDFGAADYSGSDTAKAEKRLVWTEFDDIDGLRFCVCGDTLAAWKENESSCQLYEQTSGEVAFLLDSGGLDFALPHSSKQVCRFWFEGRVSKKTAVDAAFYADGKPYFSARVWLLPGKDGVGRVCVTLPRYALNRFRFVIAGKEKMGLQNMRVDYRVL